MLGACMRVKPIDGAPRLNLRRFACTETSSILSARRTWPTLFMPARAARSRAISYRMSPNICRGTATLAIWNVPSQLRGTGANDGLGAWD